MKAGGSRYGSRWKPIKLDMEARRGLHGSSWKSMEVGGSPGSSIWKLLKVDVTVGGSCWNLKKLVEVFGRQKKLVEVNGSWWKVNGSWWKSRKHMEASGSRWRSVEVAGNSENCGKLWKAMGAPSRWTLMEDSVSL